MRRLALFLALWMAASPAQAGLIRDAEIERDIRDLSNPIFQSASLDPKSVRILIVQDPAINAYVAGGANIFIHTGLILATDTPEMLIGVIAHETGHIAGGHLARGAEAVKGAELGTVISFILGAAAAAGGSGDAGAAIMTAGPTAMQRTMLAFTRGNEQSADQAALRFLADSGVTPRGMLDMFSRLRRDEKRFLGQVDPYALTHPLTTERISTVRADVERSTLRDMHYPEAVQESHRRLRAKLEGFLNDPAQVISQHKNDPSVAGRYATAIALFRHSQIDQALSVLDGLIAKEPDNGWFYDLKGQMLFEHGRIPEARDAYAKASRLKPKEPLIRSEYAKTLLAGQSDPATIDQAITLLERASQEDPTYIDSWRLLADAEGRRGREGESHLALAEKASLEDDQNSVRSQADLALKQIAKGTPSYLRAQDLRNLAIRRAKEKRENGTPSFTSETSTNLSRFPRSHFTPEPR